MTCVRGRLGWICCPCNAYTPSPQEGSNTLHLSMPGILNLLTICTPPYLWSPLRSMSSPLWEISHVKPLHRIVSSLYTPNFPRNTRLSTVVTGFFGSLCFTFKPLLKNSKVVSDNNSATPRFTIETLENLNWGRKNKRKIQKRSRSLGLLKDLTWNLKTTMSFINISWSN